MLKESKSLGRVQYIDKIYIGAMKDAETEERETLDSKTSVWRVPVKMRILKKGAAANFLKMGEWTARLLWGFRREPIALVQCHSLMCLPICVLFKILKGSKLVYDCHELETERASGSASLRKVEKIVEAILIRFVDYTIVVSDSIERWYRDRYRLRNIRVIINVPYRSAARPVQSNILRDHFNIPFGDTIFIYQGLLSGARGIEILLRVFSALPFQKHIVFMGYGELKEEIQDHERRFPNIHFLPAVPPDRVTDYTAGADIGISLIEDVCLSYYYCLPNKVFEYILAGLPVIVSDFPDMAAVIDEYQCGWKTPVNEVGVADLINHLTPAAILEKRERALASYEKFSWEDEELKLINIYDELLLRKKAAASG